MQKRHHHASDPRLPQIGGSRFRGGLESVASRPRPRAMAMADVARAFCAPVGYALPGAIATLRPSAPAAAWASAVATLIAWRDDRPYTIDEALGAVGPSWVEAHHRGTALSPDDAASLVATTGLCMSAPQSPSAAGWEAMLRTFGPLVVMPGGEDATFPAGGRVVVGVKGDGTPEGTRLDFVDATTGTRADAPLSAFAGPLRLVHWAADAAIARGTVPAPPATPPEAPATPTSAAASLRGHTRMGRAGFGRALSTRPRYVRAQAVPDWDRPANFPKQLRDFWGRPTSRLHHYVWHVARFGRALRPQEQAAFDRLGFRAPPGGIRAQGTRGAGIDFLGMHRQMIATTRAIAEKLGLAYRPTGWDPIPWNHADPVWPMPVLPPGDRSNPDNKDPRVTATVQQAVKDFFRNPTWLAGISLDDLGNRIEGDIHAWMHMHWSTGVPANLADGDPSNDLDPALNPDWLGFFLSSQVNPIFWKLHGWVDDTIGAWERATGQDATPLLAGAWLGPVPQAGALSLGRRRARGFEADEQAGMHHGGDLTDEQALDILARLEPPDRITVVGEERTREWLAAMLGPDFAPSPEMLAEVEGAPPLEQMASMGAPRTAIRLDRHGVRQMGVPAAVEVGIAAFSAATPFLTPGDFSCTSAEASYRHQDTPPETPTRRTTAEFHVTARNPLPGAHNRFYFQLMWEHNGYDINVCSVQPLKDKSSTLLKSKFTIQFNPKEGSTPQDPVAVIRYLFSGNWDFKGPGDYSFTGELVIEADGSADLRITNAEDGAVWIETPLFTNVRREDLPVPTVMTYSPYVQFFPVASDRLTDDDARAILAWLDALAPAGSALRKELETARTPMEVHGFASTTGGWAANEDLARRRAARVETVLRQRLPNASLKAVPHGEVDAGTPNETESQKERRAEVRVRQILWGH